MTFIKATAPRNAGSPKLLSEDNTLPARHIVMDILRKAAPHLGLGAPVLTTLDAMLSCLAPTRSHHTVFASNATLAFRLNGVSDRTIRRHAAVLQEAGLLARHDSPNGKRYSKHNRHAGTTLRFGFDMGPLFAQLSEIAKVAANVAAENERIAYVRCKIRSAAQQILQSAPNSRAANDTLKMLRRKLSLAECEALLDQQMVHKIPAEGYGDDDTTPSKLTANDSQFVRHHHKSNKDNTKLESGQTAEEGLYEKLEVIELLEACPEAAAFSLRKIDTDAEVIAHARTLAPMIGINSTLFETAHRLMGGIKAAATIWALVQLHGKIHSAGAYFRVLTTGAKSAGFSPERLVRRLAAQQRYTT